MKSPFPGMDPYLEAHWGEVHTRLTVYAADQLNTQLPDNLRARIEEAVAVITEDEPQRTVYPDVAIVEHTNVGAAVAAEAATVTIAEPYGVTVDDEPQTWRHLEIVDLDQGERLVTAIEILSPANKVNSHGQLKYIQKQREYLEAGANLVEIDLIRAGNYVLSLPEDRLPAACRVPYLVCVRRAAKRNLAELYPISLRAPLVNFRVPLRPADRDVILRLQELVDACYGDGSQYRINYRLDPVPRLGEADARWVDSVLREKGLR